MSSSSISIELSDSVADLERIIEIQQLNHPGSVAPDLWETQGFVTMKYTVEELQTMCGPYRHVVAKHNDTVVGYALVLLKEHSERFPLLADMFQHIATGAYGGKPLRQSRYVVMGQVCIDENFRGKGIFKELYDKFREQMRADFDLVITEVSAKNGRSMGAHQSVGFENIAPEHAGSSEWNVIAWDWK